MFTLEHRVRVFVFQVLEDGAQFLLVRHRPTSEWPLGPVIGSVAPEEQMIATVVREVRAETGIQRPHHLIELPQPSKELFGDVGLIEWPFAYQAGTPGRPAPDLEPGPTVGELTWMPFAEAFLVVTDDADREALVKLHLDLGA